jgi:hypothetical protein
MRRIRMAPAVALLAIGAIAFAAPASATPRGGELHIVKDCSTWVGQAGGFCTITSSNIAAIPVGSRIVYASAAGATSLDTDISIATRPGNVAYGHCTLDFLDLPGLCTLSGGAGKLSHIEARVAVSPDATPNVWHWDGTYAFIAIGHR